MKILLTGNIFYEYELSIKNALIEIGHDVKLHFMNFEGPFSPTWNTINWLRFGVLPHKLGVKHFVEKSKDQYNQELKDSLQNSNFDMVIVIKGLTIDAAIFDNYKGVKALWILDSIKRFEAVQKSLQSYDISYTYEPSDVVFCKERLNHNISVLPVAYDPAFYHPTKIIKKHQVSFVGGRLPNREPFIEKLIEKLPVALVGDFYRSKNSAIKKSVLAKKANHQYINRLYNQSHVNLNIHKPQSEEGVNPRFFEILGAGGGVQMVEPKALAIDFKDFEHLVYYSSEEECVDKAKFLIKNEEKAAKIARKGCEYVVKEHTWKHRLQTILFDAENLK